MHFFKFLLPSVLFLLLTTTACEMVDIQSEKSNNEEEYSFSPKMGGLFNTSENTEFEDHTGNWFGERTGNISFGISAGMLEPNSEVSVSFMALQGKEVKLDRDVRFQLTKRDEDNKLLDVTAEEKVYIDTITSATYKEYYSTNLPEEKNIHYLLSAEILGKDGQIEDTVVTRIYVPNEDANWELYVDKDKYTSKDTLVLQLENNSPTTLLFGLPYEIEIYKQNKWEKIALNREFDLMGLRLEPGQKFEQKIRLNERKEVGKYRISKNIHSEETDINDTFSVEFEIVRD